VPNAGGILWEFMGSGGPERMRGRIGGQMLDVLELPPWVGGSRS